MARESKVIPDLYFPEEDQDLQTSSLEGEKEHGPGGEVKRKEPVDLTPEGFIPIHKLTLEDLPEPIRTQESLQYILDVSTQVVRVNNNGLSDLRPDDDQFKRAKQKSLMGSGMVLSMRRDVEILTNRHVLFNEEELEKSTFDVFFDYHHGDKDDEKKRFKRCVRKDGMHFYGKLSKDDIALAQYTVKDKMAAHIKAHCSFHKTCVFKFTQNFPHIGNKSIVACLISHPLGQPKQVSFGEMVHYDMPSRTVYHTAPSKPGSSGGRVIIFSNSLLQETIVHVGTDLLDGTRYKYSRVHELCTYSLLDMNDALDDALKKVDLTRNEDETTAEEICGTASASVETASLGAFVPIFGAFLLQAETRLKGLDANVLKPCNVSQTNEPWTSCELKPSVEKVIHKVAQAVPITSSFSSSSLDDTSDLVSLLESQGPCYCQSIVKMMERGVKLEDGTVTECFLSPYTAAAKMSSDDDVTWPWLKGSSSALAKFDAMEGCLLRKCLKLADRGIPPAVLLLLIARANADVKHLHFQSIDPSSTMLDGDHEDQKKTVQEQSKQEPRFEGNTEKQHSETRHSPPLAEKQKVSSSATEIERDWDAFIFEVITAITLMFSFMSKCFAMIRRSTPPNVASEQEESEDISTLYSRCLAVAEHFWQHEWQTHPDNVCSGHEDCKVKYCKCGRPGGLDVLRVYNSLGNVIAAQSQVVMDTLSHRADEIRCIVSELAEVNSNMHFFLLMKALQQQASDKSLPQATGVLTSLDSVDSFPRGRHSLMLFLASGDAYLYNLCLTARQVSKRLQSLYFAFPVSVFGRPGNWPGNVTPPEVQRTAWRLIQDAIMASGFGPALLAALEKDAARRENLIDLYVDMKQLKWQGKVHPWLFEVYLTALGAVMWDHVQNTAAFLDPTHYFVWYATYLVCPKILSTQSPKSSQ